MGLPISILESILHNVSSKSDMPAIIDDYLIQIDDESVTIKELVEFWKVGHEKLKSATAVLDEAIAIAEKHLGGNSERSTEKESKVSSEQEMEVVCTSSISKPKRTRRNNKVKTEKV